MVRFVVLISVFVLAASCGGKSPVVEEPPPLSNPIAETRVQSDQPSLESLEGKLGIRSFRFLPGERPRLRVVVENLQPTDSMTFEISSVFYDAAGAESERKSWAPLKLESGKRHIYLAETVHKESVSADLLLREIESHQP